MKIHLAHFSRENERLFWSDKVLKVVLGGRDGSVTLSQCSTLIRGPKFGTQHVQQLTTDCNSGSKRSNTLLWTSQVPALLCTYPHPPTHIYTNTYLEISL